MLHAVQCKKTSENHYKHILASIEPEWPPCEVEGVGVQNLL